MLVLIYGPIEIWFRTWFPFDKVNGLQSHLLTATKLFLRNILYGFTIDDYAYSNSNFSPNNEIELLKYHSFDEVLL